MKTKENGVTLMALVATIIILLILAGVGTTVGRDSIKTARFTQFKNELKILQDKVNELNQDNNLEIGQAINEEQKNILNIDVISNIIYKDATDEEKIKIQNGFGFCSSAYIKENLGFDSVERDYLINVEYRYIIAKDGFEYEGITYYIVDQLEDEFYNVRYNNKNEKTGSFEVTATQEDNKWRIEITNINYNGYINNWQVKYKLEDATYWETSDSLTFYINKPGVYIVKVFFEDSIDLGNKTITLLKDPKTSDGSWNGVVNTPDLDDTGLIPVYFNESDETVELTEDSENKEWSQWYDYSEKRWANAITKDSEGNITGYFVWIPRYEYKITYTDTSDYSKGGTIDVKFIPTTKRTVDSNYTYIHPSFQNGSATGYKNGEWDEEIPGFWVAKFPAGYAGGGKNDSNNDVTPVDSGETYSGTVVNSNYYGRITSGTTIMKYPVFLGQTYAYDNINVGDSYNLAKNLTKENNPYGLRSTEIDSHQMKNSEWGAVAYLTHSQYGLNGQNVLKINNVNLNNTVKMAHAVTGYAADGIDTPENIFTTAPSSLGESISNGTYTSYAWYTANGQKGSSTQNITGVYDLAGCVWERTSAYIENETGASYRTTYGGSLVSETDLKYKTIYPHNSSSDSNTNNWTAYKNAQTETYGYGDAILETSKIGYSWNNQYSNYPNGNKPFFVYGGDYSTGALDDKRGMFSVSLTGGSAATVLRGFRAVLITK